ncbi:hypothetical protein WICPIJ_007770 [Wickerhamomyces pijperi]|uniref:DNA replication licensing factor MCM5 n=1 Tax=Wickerhamomyces pijperi TaxID=599730 RepID=A0A9P8Q121_WICPI|nr:hypothetical protein WICPIJ_007770 [Wickerhamomyces pijperi]
MSYDRADTYTAQVLPGNQDESEVQNKDIIESFKKFILEFRIGSDFIYRTKLRENLLVHEYQLQVEAEHVTGFNATLYNEIVQNPAQYIPLFETAITEVAKRIVFLQDRDVPPHFPTCQLILRSNANRISIRDLESEHISKVVRVSGIVISATPITSKAVTLSIICSTCRHTQTISGGSSFSTPKLPKRCASSTQQGAEATACPTDPYVIYNEKSTFVDEQTLKLQELPEMVPVGEMPRHLILSVDRYLTNKVIPGTRCTINGIYDVHQSKAKGAETVTTRNPYLKVLSIETDVDHNAAGNVVFTEEEEEEFLEMSRSPDLYESFAKSIAPSIYGNPDIKKAIACLLMGGSKKILPDGMRLRGDINVLLLGDPGTAKSQLLKFVSKVAPISVYTSGKGSSAAGLTASVQRNAQTREFYLEGGAMVLADNGVVCIDEFDKMRDEDRVAIHEAMEQQTISIAKAGITTVLNSRTSVLAAANPIYGSYDQMKTPGENIDFQTTILSRFDMIFIVKDDSNEARDVSIANHVMNIHRGGSSSEETSQEGEISLEKMKRYISYCRSKCAPRLSPEAAEKLCSYYVEIRKNIHESETETNQRSSIPITVRQLEAIIRISESLAKLRLQPTATEEHVDEAIRLFRASTIDAANQGINSISPETQEQVRVIEREIKKRLPVGFSTSYETLRKEYVLGKGFKQFALDKALDALERTECVRFRHQRQNILRTGA